MRLPSQPIRTLLSTRFQKAWGPGGLGGGARPQPAVPLTTRVLQKPLLSPGGCREGPGDRPKDEPWAALSMAAHSPPGAPRCSSSGVPASLPVLSSVPAQPAVRPREVNLPAAWSLAPPGPLSGHTYGTGLLLPCEGSFALPSWQTPRALQAPVKRSLSPCHLPWLLRWQEGRLLPSLGLRLSLSFHPNSRKQSPSLLVPAQEAPFLQVLWEMLPLGREQGLLQANLPPQPPLSPPVTCAAQAPPPLPTSLMDKMQVCMNL